MNVLVQFCVRPIITLCPRVNVFPSMPGKLLREWEVAVGEVVIHLPG